MTSGHLENRARLGVARTIAETRAAVAATRRAGRTIAFVPTMGALHEGHLSLMHAAKADDANAYVVVSIYVNPTQFAPSEDFTQYPRTFEADCRACGQAGVDLIFTPTDAEMYPPGDATRVRPGPLANLLCGALRLGHFEGVCTVVAKLFNIVQPDTAYFGQKDAQQAVIIRRMVRDLCMPVRIVACPIVREPDGLAMSSRNARLSAEERQKALCLHRALCRGRDMLLAREGPPGRIIAAMHGVVAETGPGAQIDYLSIVDPETLVAAAGPCGPVMIAGAVRLGPVRLIDNVLVDVPRRGS